jgi:hypothetical protein
LPGDCFQCDALEIHGPNGADLRKERIMNAHLRQLFVASTFAVATVGVSAQTTAPKAVQTTPAPAQSAATPPATTQAQRDFEAAKAACQTERTKNALNECLRRAEDTYNKATGVPGAPLGGVGGSASGSPVGGGTNSAKQRS